MVVLIIPALAGNLGQSRESNMNRTLKAFGIAVMATAVMAAYAVVADGSFKINPKKDDVYKYKVTGSFAVMGMDVKVTFNNTETIKEVNDKGYVVENKQDNMKIDLGGQEMDGPEGTSSTAYALDGMVTKVDDPSGEDPANAYRFAVASVIVRPGKEIKVGETWTKDFAANKEKGLPKAKATYKYVKDEEVLGFKTAQIEFEYTELEGDAPAGNKGKVWIDPATGFMVKMDSEWKNMPIGGAPEPISGKAVIERVK